MPQWVLTFHFIGKAKNVVWQRIYLWSRFSPNCCTMLLNAVEVPVYAKSPPSRFYLFKNQVDLILHAVVSNFNCLEGKCEWFSSNSCINYSPKHLLFFVWVCWELHLLLVSSAECALGAQWDSSETEGGKGLIWCILIYKHPNKYLRWSPHSK